MPFLVSFPSPYTARCRKSGSSTTSSSSKNTTASKPSVSATSSPRLRMAPYPDRPTSFASLPRPSCSMRCWMRASSGAPTTTTLSPGDWDTVACTFSAAWFSMVGSLATSTTIWPMPRTFCSELRHRPSSPGCDMGVMWSYVVRMLPPSLRRRAETNVGMTITGFMRVLLPDFAFGLTGLL